MNPQVEVLGNRILLEIPKGYRITKLRAIEVPVEGDVFAVKRYVEATVEQTSL